MKAYADSGFITTLYVQEPFSEKAQALADRYGSLPFTPWHRLEVRNAIRSSVSETQSKLALKALERDLLEKMVIAHQPIDWTDCLRRAEMLSEKYNPMIRASSPDMFHVACALELGLEIFLSFDNTQSELARAAGLKVKGL